MSNQESVYAGSRGNIENFKALIKTPKVGQAITTTRALKSEPNWLWLWQDQQSKTYWLWIIFTESTIDHFN